MNLNHVRRELESHWHTTALLMPLPRTGLLECPGRCWRELAQRARDCGLVVMASYHAPRGVCRLRIGLPHKP